MKNALQLGFLCLCISLGALPGAAHASDKELNISADSPNGNWRVYGTIRLGVPDEQSLYVQNRRTGEKNLLLTSPFRSKPKVKWHGEKVVEVQIITGSPGKVSIFYDTESKERSDDIWFVIAFSKKGDIALTAGENIELVDVFTSRIIDSYSFPEMENSAVKAQLINDAFFNDDCSFTIKFVSKDGNNTVKKRVKYK